MLDLKIIINKPDFVKENLANKRFDIEVINKVIELGQRRSKFMTNLQILEAKRNKASKQIGVAKAQGKDVESILFEVAEIKKEIVIIKEWEVLTNELIKKELLKIPNLTAEDTPIGKGEVENKIIKVHDKLGKGLIKNVVPHYEIATKLDIVDFERAVKISGARFWAYKGLGARLVRALENFMLDKHIDNGYIEWRPPVIVKDNIMQGTGQLPKFEDDLFKIEGKKSYLISTAEIPLTNLHNNEILNLDETISYTAFTPCFRSEAGSGGKDMRGLIRAHQFNKVELVKFTRKENVQSEFVNMLNTAKGILNDLKLPYQELLLCTGDTGFASEKTVDLEVWIPSEKKFREISSVSSMSNFQGRRASIRYKDDEGKSQYAYTLNGSALAIDRTIAAILENYQNQDGSIEVPEVLIPYMGEIKEIK